MAVAATFLVMVLGLLLLMGGTVLIAIWSDKPPKKVIVPPEPPRADASVKELAKYHRDVAAYYRKKNKYDDAAHHDNLAVGYESMGREDTL